MADPPLVSAKQSLTEIYAPISIPHLHSWEKYSLAGITNDHIRSYAELLLRRLDDYPAFCAEWEALVYKWIDLETMWVGEEVSDKVFRITTYSIL
jgi:hypothetical protein